jgi:hypothetical protein
LQRFAVQSNRMGFHRKGRRHLTFAYHNATRAEHVDHVAVETGAQNAGQNMGKKKRAGKSCPLEG